MIGIYKIQNKINGKVYIGQSNHIEKRFRQHCYSIKRAHGRSIVDYDIEKYGKENFDFSIIEECFPEQLNERETYWISYYDSYKNGYNCNEGGEQQSIGENNGRAQLTEDDVKEIRAAYNNHERCRDVYQHYKNKITWGSFQSVWRGACWRHVMPEVFTQANKNYYIYKNSLGEKGNKATLTNKKVAQYRYRYQNETARDMYPEVQDKLSYTTFQKNFMRRRLS